MSDVTELIHIGAGWVTHLSFMLRHVMMGPSLLQRVTLLDLLLPLPQLLPGVVLPAEVRREAGLADAARRPRRRSRRRGPRRPSGLVPLPLALPDVHFADGLGGNWGD